MKIESIQKGDIYYHTEKIEFPEKNGVSRNYSEVISEINHKRTYVDKISCNWVDKEQTFDNQNSGHMLTYTMKLVYQGWKDNKLVFEMFNPDLIIYDNN